MNMKVTVFDVGHGGCALVEADTGAKMLIDCGRKSDGTWSPSQYLKFRGISHLDSLVITNYDDDHAKDLANVRAQATIGTLHRNVLVSPEQIQYLKTEDGMGPGIEELCRMARAYTGNSPSAGGPGVNWGGITFKGYCNSPTEFDDENNLSVAWFVSYAGFCMLFPGDLEKAGWKAMLAQPGFIEDLQKVTILVASHHGRENGCCDEIFSQTGWKPRAVIISDDYIQYGTQEGTSQWYHQRSTGVKVSTGDERHVITTRKDGHVFIDVDQQGTFWVDTPAYQKQRAAA